MRFPESERVIYQHNPLAEVICQLRFDSILRIEAEPPAGFQDRIRQDYPRYSERSEVALPEGVAPEVRAALERAVSAVLKQERRVAHEFRSIDEEWSVVLARDFVALTTTGYQRWEQFSTRLELVLDALNNTFSPGAFTRIGLRYKDVITRSALGLESARWSELLAPHVAAELGTAALVESEVLEARRVLRLRADDGLQINLQHGIARPGADGEPSYLIDVDLFVEERIHAEESRHTVERAHDLAGRIFRWCISDRLHAALQPSSP